jgi:hypothetical protein
MLQFTLLLATASIIGGVAVPSESEILKSLRPEHPRLIGLPEDLRRVKTLIAEDSGAAAVYKSVKRRADELLARKDTVEYKIVGPRLLSESRKCVSRVYTLATVYRIDGDRRYADRAIEEMLAAAAFKDWNPSHFLDTAEMTHALAIGYDWLYDSLSPEQKQTIRRAIVEKGLREAEKVYRNQRWWSRSRHNWNQVCNGGIALGALAVAEEEPQLAAYILNQAATSVQIAMSQFAPDGAWSEGPGYWNYATRYNVYMLAGLESALGTDFGLSTFEGFSVTGDFRIHFVGPSRLAFNFADGGAHLGQAAQMFWLARKFDKPLYAWHEREYVGGDSALHLWWFDPRGRAADEFGSDFPTARWFRHADVVMIRGKWDDPRTVFVGFKGGDNKVNHSHLELGTFVLDADGQRWAVDLGPDNYNLPSYFGSKRWTYYRLATAGQNTLLIDGRNQDPKAVTPIVAFGSRSGRAYAVADLSAAYAGQVKKVRRGVAVVDRRSVLVQDEIEGTAGAEITWQMHTPAKIELNGDRTVLKQGDRVLRAQILSPGGAVFTTEPAKAPPPQRQQPEVTKLVVRLAGNEGLVRLAVLFTPVSDAAPLVPVVPPVIPLSNWSDQAAK